MEAASKEHAKNVIWEVILAPLGCENEVLELTLEVMGLTLEIKGLTLEVKNEVWRQKKKAEKKHRKKLIILHCIIKKT